MGYMKRVKNPPYLSNKGIPPADELRRMKAAEIKKVAKAAGIEYTSKVATINELLSLAGA